MRAVDAATAGCSAGKRVETISPHPLGTLRFERCRVPARAASVRRERDSRSRWPRSTSSVAPSERAALGFARRALNESVAHANRAQLFGAPLGALQLTQAAIAAMATDVDASALLVYRAAWVKDSGAPRA